MISLLANRIPEYFTEAKSNQEIFLAILKNNFEREIPHDYESQDLEELLKKISPEDRIKREGNLCIYDFRVGRSEFSFLNHEYHLDVNEAFIAYENRGFLSGRGGGVIYTIKEDKTVKIKESIFSLVY